jgi:phosphatidate cytidylyltransferase
MSVYFLVGLIGLGIIDIRYAYLILLALPVTVVLELFRKEGAGWNRIGVYFTGFFFVSLPFGLLNALFVLPDREGYVKGILIGMFVIVWSSDIFAYLTGSLFGKHRLFERISPKKSWEGSIGGLLFALLAAYILSLFFTELSLTRWLVMAAIVVITGTLGDLSESFLKRKAGVKDSGNIFPGHGGVLDRFDAALFAVPFVFIYINLF